MMIPVKLIINDVTQVDQHEIDVLKDSIKTQGLFHPIIVQSVNGQFKIVSGRKRYISVLQLNWPEIDATVMDENLDPLKAEEISLHENLKRSNLTWWEQAEVTLKLHEIKQRQIGAPTLPKGGGSVKTGWSLRDTAKELGVALGAVSRDINLAKMLQLNPSLKKIKDRVTAIKVARQYAQRADMEDGSVDVPPIDVDTVLLASSVDVLPSFPKFMFDACITDPPWEKYINKSLTKDDDTFPVFKEVFRILKANAIMYLFCGTDDFLFYRDNLPKLGFKVQNHPLIWYKKGVLTHGLRSWEYARNFELILVAARGSPALTVTSQLTGVMEFAPVPSVKLTHPNEKPIELIEHILGHCSYDFGTILDPFAGSGVVGEACKNMSRHYVLVEKEHKYHKQIVERLK